MSKKRSFVVERKPSRKRCDACDTQFASSADALTCCVCVDTKIRYCIKCAIRCACKQEEHYLCPNFAPHECIFEDCGISLCDEWKVTNPIPGRSSICVCATHRPLMIEHMYGVANEMRKNS